MLQHMAKIEPSVRAPSLTKLLDDMMKVEEFKMLMSWPTGLFPTRRERRQLQAVCWGGGRADFTTKLCERGWPDKDTGLETALHREHERTVEEVCAQCEALAARRGLEMWELFDQEDGW